MGLKGAVAGTAAGDGSSDAPLTVDAVVLGAGISGLVSCSVLLEQGCETIAVVDSYEGVGGNHLDDQIGPYTFDVGSLIFQDDSPLLAHFPELLDLYVEIDPSWSRLNPQGRVTAYPFSVQDDLLRAGPVELARIIASAVVARLRRRDPTSARDFAEHWLGPRFVEHSGLGHYMERFCGVPAEDIDVEFARSRMMWIADHARLGELARRAIGGLRRTPPRPRVNRQLARPRAGFGALYAPTVARLQDRGVRFALGVGLERLEHTSSPHGERFTLTTSRGELRARRVISTIPVDHALVLSGLPSSRLPTVTLLSLYFSFSGRRAFDSTVLYNFSDEGSWKRLTVYSDFYGRIEGADRTEFFTVEVISTRSPQSAAEAAEAFRRHTSANGLLDGDLHLEGSRLLPHAYPVYTRGSGARAREGIAALTSFGVESLGRQGGFQYQPTARHSTVEAEAALARSTARTTSTSDPGTP